MESMSYKRNTFCLKKNQGGYRSPDYYVIQDVEVQNEVLEIPEFYSGHPVKNIIWDEKSIPLVKILRIPRTIENININNDSFPDLELVEIDQLNENYETDGKTICEKRNYYRSSEKYLCYCPVLDGDSFVLGDDIDYVQSGAFKGTKFRTIVFPNKKLKAAADAFDGSAWLEHAEYPVMAGKTLLKVDTREKEVIIPKDTKWIHEGAFSGSRASYWYGSCNIETIKTPFLPSPQIIEKINYMPRCRNLVITSPKANINIHTLQKLENIEYISIPEGHKKYSTSCGVVFSVDGKKLVYYPHGRKDQVYVIPYGVEKIEESAFAGQDYLEVINMMDTVKTICARAFLNCRRLSKVQFSPKIKELPESNAYLRGGVFEGCVALKEVELPENMVYVGSFAFANSGLEKIVLNAKLQQIGEYGLMAKHLTEISLPESVQRLGKGSLFFVRKMSAYEGTAKGLVSAVNATNPEDKDKAANLAWRRCDVTVLHKRSNKQEIFMIPGSLSRNAAYHLDAAWNNDKIDYEEYDECLEKIGESSEKIDFAMNGVQRYGAADDNPFANYLRRVSYKIAVKLLEEKKEKEFLKFLKEGFLSDNSLSKLVKVSNQYGMTVCSAYIMQMQKKKKKASFRL